GVLHSERNDGWRAGSIRHDRPHTEPVHLVQMWVVPDESGGDPGYDQRAIDQAELTDDLVVVAGGKDLYPARPATRIRIRSSSLLASRPGPGRSLFLPDGSSVPPYFP